MQISIPESPDPGARELRSPSRWRPEIVFPAMIAVFGLVFALLVPPWQGPDENVHFCRSYSLSSGHVIPPMIVDGWGGDVQPARWSFMILESSKMWFRQDVKLSDLDYKNKTILAMTKPDVAPVPVDFGGSVMYMFVAFIPQASGIALARAVGFDGWGVFYAGRIANLLVCVLLVYAAIRVTPMFKCAFGVIPLIPLSLAGIASYSPDSTVLGTESLLIAVILRIAVGVEARLRVRWVGLMLAVTTWLACCKLPYAMTALLYVAVPSARMGSRARYLRVGLAIGLIIVGSVVVSGRMSRGYAADSRQLPNYQTSVQGQTRYILEHKIDFLMTFARSLIQGGKHELIDHLRNTSIDTQCNALAAQVFFIFLLAIAALDQPQDLAIPRGMKAAAGIAAILILGLMYTAQYIWHSPVGAPYVQGIQGRYLIPILPLLPFLLRSSRIRVQAEPREVLTMAAAGSTAMLMIAICALVQRYYLPDPPGLLAEPNTVAAAVLFLSVVSLVSWQRRDAIPLEKRTYKRGHHEILTGYGGMEKIKTTTSTTQVT